MSNGQIPIGKKLWGLVKMTLGLVHCTCELQLANGTSCKTDFLCRLLDSNIFFSIATLTLLTRKRGHTGFQIRPP